MNTGRVIALVTLLIAVPFAVMAMSYSVALGELRMSFFNTALIGIVFNLVVVLPIALAFFKEGKASASTLAQ